MRRFISFGLTALFVLAAHAAAVDLKAVRAGHGPKIDGDLSDAVWQSALPFLDFRMAEPKPDWEPTEKTELRILYDNANLYIGILCRDGDPGRIAANTMAHDAGTQDFGMHYGYSPDSSSDDIIRVLIDPFQDKRTAYVFSINPLGGRAEGLAYSGSTSMNWDGIWEGKSRISGDGWSAEFRIPFKTISFKPGLSAWGLNVERVIARKQETIRLSGTGRDSFFANPMEAARLTGIENIEQGKGITFRPYGLGSVQKNGPAIRPSHDWNMEGGFDLYKSFTPNLVGVVSCNMDFAETEADERRINLTRFPLFFPEKRMFFLEGSENFSFSSSVSFMPFFSRRIGLSEGRQIPVLFGTKLYGKVGDTNISVLDVQTGRHEGMEGCNLFAARVTQNIFAQSRVGWILTNGSQTGEKNTLAGMDFNYSSSKFLGDKNIMLASWMAYNWNEKKGGRHHGFGFRGDYPNDLWDVQTTYAYYGESLDPGLGYMMRQGVQTAFARVSFQPRPVKGFLGRVIRQFFFEAVTDNYWDLSGNLETSELSITPVSLRTESGERLAFEIKSTRDILPCDFEVSRGVVLPARDYNFTNFELELGTAAHRPAVMDVGYAFGEFYSGRYDDLDIGLTLKFKGYANLSIDTCFIRGRLPQGNFKENVYQIKADLFLSPDLGFMNYVQYDSVSRELGWSTRLRWQISPGNEIYLVYNKSWERRWDPTSRFLPAEERGVLKFSLSFRP